MATKEKEFWAWVYGVVAAAAASVSFLFMTFQTKADALKAEETVERVSNKVDSLLFKAGIDPRRAVDQPFEAAREAVRRGEKHR